MKLLGKILAEILAFTGAGVLVFLAFAAIVSFITWDNKFVTDDSMVGLRVFVLVGFASGIVRVGILLKHGSFK